MVLDEITATTNRLPEELGHPKPRHFDHRTLRLERGLYVIRERTNRTLSDNLTQKKGYPVDPCSE